MLIIISNLQMRKLKHRESYSPKVTQLLGNKIYIQECQFSGLLLSMPDLCGSPPLVTEFQKYGQAWCLQYASVLKYIKDTSIKDVHLN